MVLCEGKKTSAQNRLSAPPTSPRRRTDDGATRRKEISKCSVADANRNLWTAARSRRYESDADDLRFGYWEYGDQIVVTASSEKDRAANDSRNAEEVSPEMLNAGWSAFYKFADDRSGPNNETIIAVYLAMRRVSRQQKGDKE